jgi:tetratricopeptide (TPR) repeat protein
VLKIFKNIIIILAIAFSGFYLSGYTQSKGVSEKVIQGKQYLALGQNQKAIELFSSALAGDASDAEACFYLALSYYDLNQFDNAKQYFIRARDLYQKKGDREGLKKVQPYIKVLSCKDTIISGSGVRKR